ncbi:MAG: hypothetical protein LBG48_02580 [Rickettsiales bacterium]|jgi:hypothetical protein|nr:hypothetical protein [Rickettsiales bacterium]
MTPITDPTLICLLGYPKAKIQDLSTKGAQLPTISLIPWRNNLTVDYVASHNQLVRALLATGVKPWHGSQSEKQSRADQIRELIITWQNTLDSSPTENSINTEEDVTDTPTSPHDPTSLHPLLVSTAKDFHNRANAIEIAPQEIAEEVELNEEKKPKRQLPEGVSRFIMTIPTKLLEELKKRAKDEHLSAARYVVRLLYKVIQP